MEFFKVITPDEAKQIIVANWQFRPQVIKSSVIESLGKILAVPIQAVEDIPGFAKSTVDGYAVLARDTFGALESLPAYLNLIGHVEMGTSFSGELTEGTAVKVPTGGMLPRGADAVVMLEQTEEVGDSMRAVVKAVAPGENVILAGEDMACGSEILSAGHQLKPFDLGVLAAVGRLEVEVWEPVKVGIISTGDEIVSPEKLVGPGQVRDINSFVLAGFVREAGGRAVKYGIVPDRYQLLKEAIERSVRENDLTLVSGGSSVGTRDYTGRILEELGEPGVLFHGVSIKPGKPTLAAVVREKLVFGLPGHPASAITAYRLLVHELVQWGQYREQSLQGEKNKLPAMLAKGVASAAGRKDYIPVKLNKEPAGWVATPLLGKSGLILPLVRSDGYLVIQLHSGGLEAGEMVTITLW